MTIQQYEANVDRNLNQLATQLAEERYYPLPLLRFSIRKPSGGTRELGILAIQDRIVQRAVCDLIEPIFEAEFLDCSFGFRPNRNVEMAIAKVMEYRTAGNQWAVDADITKCFDTMDHQVLMHKLRSSVKEPCLLRLIQTWLDMGAITQTPPLPPWMTGAKKTAHYLGHVVEQAIAQLLDHNTHGAYGYDQFIPLQGRPVAMPPYIENNPIEEEGQIHTNPTEISSSIWARARQEALGRFGRDGLLLLLSCSKGLFKRLSPKYLLIAAPIILTAAALPSIGGAIKTQLTRPRLIGTVQGSPLSPLFANIYLHEFDKGLTQAGERLVRYADDFLILCPNEQRAIHSLELVRRHLATLKLTLNAQKTRIVHLDSGVTFLGHVFDADGCYQPVPSARASIVRKQMQHALHKGATQATNTGRTLARTGRRMAMRLTAPLKKKKDRQERKDKEK